MNFSFSRRALLSAAALGGAVLPLLYAASAQSATDPRVQRLQESIRRVRARNDQVLTGRQSVNGWEMERAADVRGNIHGRSVVGTTLTGVQIRPGHYPVGVRGGFFPLQEEAIRDILASLEGVVRWGGDDARPDESLFSIDLPPGDTRVAEVAARLREAEGIASEKVGVAVDLAAPARRKAATALKRRQRR